MPKPQFDLNETAARFQDALDETLDMLKQDEQVLAVLLQGSMAHDRVWPRSDIDMLIVVKDQKLVEDSATLITGGVMFAASILQRTEFIRMVESVRTGSVSHSTMSKGKLIYLRDENLRSYFERMSRLGDRDRDLLYLSDACGALYMIDKTDKWLYVRGDPDYAFSWLYEAMHSIARLEVLRHNEIPLREVIQQAEAMNPDFFRVFYRDVSNQPKSIESVGAASDACRAYIADNAHEFFKEILDYLKEEQDARSVSEMLHHFSKKMRTGRFLFEHVMPFLCEQGYTEEVFLPVRLTPKSHVMLEEAAYLFVQPN